MSRAWWNGGRPVEVAARLAPALAGLGTVLVAAAFASDRSTAPATAWLGLSAAAVLAPVLLAARRERLPLALVALLAPAAIVLLPRQGAVPLAPLTLLLAAALALLAVDLDRRPEPSRAHLWLAFTLAAQSALRFDRFWSPPLDPVALGVLVGAPALAALLLSVIDRASGRDREDRRGPARAGAGGAATVAATLVAAGPGFTALGLAALALAAVVAHLRPGAARWAPLCVALPAFGHEPAWAALALCGFGATAGLGASRLAHAGRALVGVVALGALLAAAPPWLRARPVSELLEALARSPFARLETPLADQSLPLSEASPRAEWPLSGGPVGTLVVDSFLTDATALDCDRVVATVRLSRAGRPSIEAAIRVGDGSGEWASARPDVAAALACRSLVPFSHWLPADGRFLGRTYRARIAVEPSYPAERLEIERAADLPASVRIHLQRVASER